MVLVKDTSPTPNALGAANGLAQFFMCMARAVAPAFVRSAFSFLSLLPWFLIAPLQCPFRCICEQSHTRILPLGMCHGTLCLCRDQSDGSN